MTIKIKSFRYFSDSETRWESIKIDFADLFTVFLGENGAGKTPMLWGMAYALGYPHTLAPDVAQNIDCAEIVLIKDEIDYTFTRKIQDSFFLEVNNGLDKENFSDERSYSDYFFKFFGIGLTKLSSTRATGNGTLPYVSNFLPLFWISQSKGWTYTYQPLQNQKFIKDQQDEMVRLLFNIPSKHPFERKKEFENKKIQLDVLLKELEISRLAVEKHRAELGELANSELATIENEKKQIKVMIEEARNRLRNEQSGTRELDVIIGDKRSQIFQLESEKSGIESKISSFEKASTELDGETEILESNEVAVDEFKKFCGAFDCKMFDSSRKLYAKRLLYLKDQLKDIKASSNSLNTSLETCILKIKAEKESLAKVISDRDMALKLQGTSEIFNRIEELGKEFSLKDEDYRKVQTHQKLKNEFIDKINKKTVIENELKELKPKGKKDNTRLSDVLSTFNDCFSKWLKTLKTPNIKSALIDESFNAIIDGSRFSEDSAQDGSTRSRIVLAYIASLLETSFLVKGNHPGFIFLDTPRQHELHLPDLKNYFSELRKLMKQNEVQIVIACKDKIFNTEVGDIEYTPNFKFEKELRYLGPPALEQKK